MLIQFEHVHHTQREVGSGLSLSQPSCQLSSAPPGIVTGVLVSGRILGEAAALIYYRDNQHQY